MRKTAYLIIILLLSVKVFPQNLDSLYNEYINLRNTEVINEQSPASADEHQDHLKSIKCGFGINGLIFDNFERFSPEQQSVLKQMVSRPVSDTSVLSPSGLFRIHYNKTGSSKPHYSGINIPAGSDTLKIMIDSVAAVFDHVYDFEVNELGYFPNPSDGGLGGDNAYDVYIENLGSSLYGETVFDGVLGENKRITYLRIDNDYINHHTIGFDAVKVTAAHEYHHAIQVGSYIYRSDDIYYYELSSTAMEEFAYDYVNDYYSYMSGYFSNPSRSFSSGSGYDFAIWNIYMQKRFGYDALKRVWEIMSNDQSALKGISTSIFENNSTFKDELNFFGQQVVLTGYRAAHNTIFDEAADYPLIFLSRPYDGNTNVTVNSNAAANNFLSFMNTAGGITDTVVTVITNSDLSDKASFNYIFLTGSAEGASKIINNYYYKITGSNLGMLKLSSIFNNEPVNGNDIEKTEIEFPFPQPFKYSMNKYIYIPVASNNTGEAALNIYTVSMDLVYSGTMYITPGNKIKLMWNGLDKNNAKLPTGVYIYVTKSGDNIKKGKILIYNE